MVTDLGKLKEQKFPKYYKETVWNEYSLKLEMSCSIRGNDTKVIQGIYLNEVTAPDANGVYADPNDTAKAAENNRVHADLIQAMSDRTLTIIIKNSKSDKFPTGCAKTALQNLEKELWGST